MGIQLRGANGRRDKREYQGQGADAFHAGKLAYFCFTGQ
jgi:hypothetical protein